MDKKYNKKPTAKGSTARHQGVVKQSLVSLSENRHCRVWPNNTGLGGDLNSERIIRFGLKGSSDIIGLYRGIFLAVEVKTGNAKQTKEQKNFQKMVDSLGGIYVLIREKNVEQINTIVEQRYNELC